MAKRRKKAWEDCRDRIITYLYGYERALTLLGEKKQAHVLKIARKDIERVAPIWREERP